MNRFSEELVREYNDAFMNFDADGSGDILILELRDMLKNVGCNPTDEALDKLVLVCDVGSFLYIFRIGTGLRNFKF